MTTISAVIMAGGRGERFWPKSTKARPKQFQSLTNDARTMIQLTFDRLLPFVEPQNIYVVTNAEHRGLVEEQLPQMHAGNILCEPAGRNTAPCIAFAAAVISRKCEDSVMLILPSDHMIKNESRFIDTLKKAAQVAQKGENLVTIGITPTEPETAYGYIKFKKSGDSVYEVERFVEKPDSSLAKEYVESGEYLWNSGMFAWKVKTIIDSIKTFLPNLYSGFLEIRESVDTELFEATVKRCFDVFESVSVDYGIMEKAANIYTVPGDFGWNDVGNWTAIEKLREKDGCGNVKSEGVIAVETYNSIILGNSGGKKLIAAVGVENLIIVDTDDAILVCAKDSVQSLRKVEEILKRH